MAGEERQEDEQFQYICWRHDAWLKTYPLTEWNAIDYFKNSQFYDPNCNNQLIRTQNIDQAKLKEMVGVEYEMDRTVLASDNPCYVIRKQYRHSPTEATLLALYYVVAVGPLRGTVYPMPTVHNVLHCNAMTALHFVGSALEDLSQHVKFDSVLGYSFSTGGASSSEPVDAAAGAAVDKEVSALVDGVLASIIQQPPPPPAPAAQHKDSEKR